MRQQELEAIDTWRLVLLKTRNKEVNLGKCRSASDSSSTGREWIKKAGVSEVKLHACVGTEKEGRRHRTQARRH